MMAEESKNLIIICIDGARLDRVKNSSVYKNLETKGIFFTETITYAPYTNSSIHALISGSYGYRNGCNSYWHSINYKNSEFTTLSQYLQGEGFFTYADLHSDLVLPNFGFDEFHVFDENETVLETRHIELLEKMKKKNEEGKKFFLYLHYSNIHTEIMNSVLKIYNNFSNEYFSNRDTNEKNYDKFFQKSELYLKTIQQKITELNLWENSIILIISDHGISVGEKLGERAYGAFCYDYTIKTFAYYLSKEFISKKISQQVRHIDFMPTILDQLKIPQKESSEKMDGISLIPLINGDSFPELYAFTETGNPLENKAPPKKPNTKSIRTSKWKLIYNEYNETKELYDLESDPDENINLISKNLDIEKELWEKLIEHL